MQGIRNILVWPPNLATLTKLLQMVTTLEINSLIPNGFKELRASLSLELLSKMSHDLPGITEII